MLWSNRSSTLFSLVHPPMASPSKMICFYTKVDFTLVPCVLWKPKFCIMCIVALWLVIPNFLNPTRELKGNFFGIAWKLILSTSLRKVMCVREWSKKILLLLVCLPLLIPTTPKTNVGLDFVEELPNSPRLEVILVVVDKLTKYVHFIPISNPYTTKIASLLMRINKH